LAVLKHWRAGQGLRKHARTERAKKRCLRREQQPSARHGALGGGGEIATTPKPKIWR
jgi:hypothetical protein